MSERHSAENDAPCCDFRDHSPGPCACPEHERSEHHPFGEPGWMTSSHDANGDGEM